MARRLAGLDADGFSLVELMTALAVLAILVGLAIPAFDNFILSTRLRTYANDFAASVQLARGEAKKRNAVVTLCPSSNGSSCANSTNWAQGWIVLSGSSVLRHRQATASGYQMSSAVTALSFQPSGFGSTQTTLLVCRASPVGSQEREVSVSATGRTRVKKTSAGSCPTGS
ncbi:GspH/FimT family pseudopilin [Pseudomonas sp. CAU 1711]|uniref:GspH/FimT family pseudopilin n=1 Tax=Pseudomonas sp. CAU 1711 TaxID=3140356 RepID=UPI0032615BF2